MACIAKNQRENLNPNGKKNQNFHPLPKYYFFKK